MLRMLFAVAFTLSSLFVHSLQAEELKTGRPIVLPKIDMKSLPKTTAGAVAPAIAYPEPGKGGKTYTVERTSRGSTTTIPEADIIKYCSDKSGCVVSIRRVPRGSRSSSSVRVEQSVGL